VFIKMTKVSVCLATYNEEKNLSDLLESVQELASEIIVVDGGSNDQTVEIAKRFGAKVVVTNNPPIFHINKQKAMDMANNPWILQMDADERVTKSLAKEINKVTMMSEEDHETYQQNLPSRELFQRHQAIIVQRDGEVGDQTGPYNAFFIPRRNFFLGKYLKYGGTYPDPAIRLIRKGKAYLPCKDVHEQMVVEGRVGWLQNYMLHKDSPTFDRYLERNNRYIDLMIREMKEDKLSKDPLTLINYLVIKPIYWFLLTTIRHKGLLDGYQGLIFSFFSALRFPRAYIGYIFSK
jgi:glycosyltransferase involved in cell wall biosynthesis